MKPQVFAGSKPEPGKLKPVTNRPDFHWKPFGGIWTSTYTDPEDVCAWVEWCRGENFGDLSEMWVVQPAEAWVCSIQDPDDRADLTIWARRPARAGAGDDAGGTAGLGAVKPGL